MASIPSVGAVAAAHAVLVIETAEQFVSLQIALAQEIARREQMGDDFSRKEAEILTALRVRLYRS